MEHLVCRHAKLQIPPPTTSPLVPQPDLKNEGGVPPSDLYRTREQVVLTDEVVAKIVSDDFFELAPEFRQACRIRSPQSFNQPNYRPSRPFNKGAIVRRA